MSAHIKGPLEVAVHEARTYLDDPIDFSFPEAPAPLPTSETCRNKIQEFDDLLEDLQPILINLDNGLANWGQLRVVMSKEEREADTPIIEKFLSDRKYCEIVTALQKYIKNITRARRRYNAALPQEAPSTASSNSAAPSQIVVTTAPPPPDDVVLEPFKIPKFGGSLYEWPTWWDCFKYAVHDTNKKLLCLYTFHSWRMNRQRRQEMAHQIQYLPHSRANPIQFHLEENQNEHDPRAEYARIARPHMGRNPSQRASQNFTHTQSQTRDFGEARSPSPVRNIVIQPFRH